MTQLFLQGLVMGFCIAAPVGPIGLLCIRRSMTDGRLVGFVSGLGAATADALYGILAALGLTAVTRLLLDHRVAIQLGGGIFLVAIGLKTLRARPATVTGPEHAPSRLAAYASTLALTLANPATIVAFIGIFAGFGIGVDTHQIGAAAALVVGVFLGSAVWWLLLSTSASWLAGKAAAGHLRFLNVVSGTLIALFGLWQLGSLAFG